MKEPREELERKLFDKLTAEKESLKATPLKDNTLEVIDEAAPWRTTAAAEKETEREEEENKEVKAKARPKPTTAEEDAKYKNSGTEGEETETEGEEEDMDVLDEAAASHATLAMAA